MNIPWWLVSLVVIVAVVWWIVYAIRKNQKREFSCATCDKDYDTQSNLVRCSKCGRMFCSDNLETIRTTSMDDVYVEFRPAKAPSKYPCGSMCEFKGQNANTHYYCKQHAPQFDFPINFSPLKSVSWIVDEALKAK
jgi:hypothetical protein